MPRLEDASISAMTAPDDRWTAPVEPRTRSRLLPSCLLSRRTVGFEMPAAFLIDHDERIIRSRAWGLLIDSDLFETQRRIREDPRFEPTYCQLFDFTAVEQLSLTGEGLRKLAQNSPFSRDARRAIVVGTEGAYGMARMYALLSDRNPEHFRIFRDTASAVKWLRDEPAEESD